MQGKEYILSNDRLTLVKWLNQEVKSVAMMMSC